MNGNRRRATNLIEVSFLARWLVLMFLLGLTGFFFVYIKNQQHAAGNQSRLLEAAICEAEARSEALGATITALTSRGALQRRVDDGFIRLEPIRDTAIARIKPALPAEADGVLRTASMNPASRLGEGTPQRSISR